LRGDKIGFSGKNKNINKEGSPKNVGKPSLLSTKEGGSFCKMG
jgi:hypothetical protein